MARVVPAKFFFSGDLQKRCPNAKCRNHRPDCSPAEFIRRGFFVTKWNGQPVRRYQCRACRRTFSSHTWRPHYRQHRPDLNDRVFRLYVSGITQRRMAIVLGVNRKTVVRKFVFLAKLARSHHDQRIARGTLLTGSAQFDEMQTFEHTRLKPVTIAIAVRAKTGEVIDATAAPISYRGPLAAIAFRKYGPRRDRSRFAIAKTLRRLSDCARPQLVVTTDRHPAYPQALRSRIPYAFHHATSRIPKTKTDRKNKNDALFTLNYTAAKLRNDLSRLGRKNWVTTKKISRLQAHLDLYLAWNHRYKIAL